ncbi:hypothetical protein AYI69_g8957, partial [Smittium culicis]
PSTEEPPQPTSDAQVATSEEPLPPPLPTPPASSGNPVEPSTEELPQPTSDAQVATSEEPLPPPIPTPPASSGNPVEPSAEEPPQPTSDAQVATSEEPLPPPLPTPPASSGNPVEPSTEELPQPTSDAQVATSEEPLPPPIPTPPASSDELVIPLTENQPPSPSLSVPATIASEDKALPSEIPPPSQTFVKPTSEIPVSEEPALSAPEIQQPSNIPSLPPSSGSLDMPITLQPIGSDSPPQTNAPPTLTVEMEIEDSQLPPTASQSFIHIPTSVDFGRLSDSPTPTASESQNNESSSRAPPVIPSISPPLINPNIQPCNTNCKSIVIRMNINYEKLIRGDENLLAAQLFDQLPKDISSSANIKTNRLMATSLSAQLDQTRSIRADLRKLYMKAGDVGEDNSVYVFMDLYPDSESRNQKNELSDTIRKISSVIKNPDSSLYKNSNWANFIDPSFFKDVSSVMDILTPALFPGDPTSIVSPFSGSNDFIYTLVGVFVFTVIYMVLVRLYINKHISKGVF